MRRSKILPDMLHYGKYDKGIKMEEKKIIERKLSIGFMLSPTGQIKTQINNKGVTDIEIIGLLDLLSNQIKNKMNGQIKSVTGLHQDPNKKPFDPKEDC